MKIGSNKKKSTFPAIPEKSPKGTDHLAIVWNDKSEMKYPSIWLRDNCRCTKVHFDTILSVNKTTTSEPICSEHEKKNHNEFVLNIWFYWFINDLYHFLVQLQFHP